MAKDDPAGAHASDGQPVPASRKFLLGLVLILLALSLYLALPYLAAIVLALVIGFLLHPLYRRVLPAARAPTFAAAVVLLAFTLALVVPLVVIAQQLTDEARMVMDLAQDPQGARRRIVDALEGLGFSPERADAVIGAVVDRLSGALSSALVPTLTNALHLLGGLLIFFILLFFVLRDGEALVAAARHFTPLERDEKDLLYALVAQRVKAIALGTFVVAAIQGVVGALGWWFFGFPAPVFWGFVITVVGILPFGAPFMIMLPAAAYAIVQGDYFSGIGMLVYTVVLVGLIDDLVRPYVVGKSAGVHPAVILVGGIGGLTVFGISGFVLGPLFLSLVQPVLDVWARKRQEAEAEGDLHVAS